MPTRRNFLKAGGIAAAGILGFDMEGQRVVNAAKRAARQLQGGEPNFLIFMVDQQRFPTPYESAELQAFREQFMPTQHALAANGLSFQRQYVAANACSPSRGSFYTGHYPSLHGVTNTTGISKGAFDPDMFWLEPNMVPTFGHYFSAAGYRTFWKGKWHASEANMLIPSTHDPLPSYVETTGARDPNAEALYLEANNLSSYGFDGWIGPEPHGSDPLDSGSSAVNARGRDIGYAEQTCELIEQLAAEGSDQPWLIVSSFVNPHDISLYGIITRASRLFDFSVDSTVPTNLFDVGLFSQTRADTLEDKPSAQASYRTGYREWLQPIVDNEFYYRLYYQLHKNVDAELGKVYQKLKDSPFFNDTIVVFISDHGELLGAHGDLHQKWHNAYEEAIHVPYIISNPQLFPEPATIDILTSHIDMLPTLLGLAGLDADELLEQISEDFSDPMPLVGRDLSDVVRGNVDPEEIEEPVYFMTDDDPSRGLKQHNFLGIPYRSVSQPNHVETVIARIDGELWKFSRYFDNPQFWSDPGQKDLVTRSLNVIEMQNPEPGRNNVLCEETVKLVPESDEFEMYNLSQDPLELANLASSASFASIRSQLSELLGQQCEQKRLYPESGKVPGQPGCPVSERQISLDELRETLALK